VIAEVFITTQDRQILLVAASHDMPGILKLQKGFLDKQIIPALLQTKTKI